jgi:hypothetical protein
VGSKQQIGSSLFAMQRESNQSSCRQTDAAIVAAPLANTQATGIGCEQTNSTSHQCGFVSMAGSHWLCDASFGPRPNGQRLPGRFFISIDLHSFINCDHFRLLVLRMFDAFVFGLRIGLPSFDAWGICI